MASVATFAFIAMVAAMAVQAAHIHWPVASLQAQNSAPKNADKLAARPKIMQQLASAHRAKFERADPLLPETVDYAVQAISVSERIRQTVPADLFPYFDVYLYVSKAARGAWAQHMYIFHKGENGDLVFENGIPVSTGRERSEKYFTTTPTGLFELDPNRFDRVHYSHVWNEAPMPWAMFLNYTVHGHLAGIALHSWAGHEVALGQRASGGCVRLPPDEARYLFERFQREEAGLVPVFALDPASNTTDTRGRIVRDSAGNPVLAGGYRVLLIIQDDPGGPALVASIS